MTILLRRLAPAFLSLFLVLPSTAAAVDDVEVEGVIEAADAESITVAGMTFLFTDDTAFRSGRDVIDREAFLALYAADPNLEVEVEGFFAEEALYARKVAVEDPDDDGDDDSFEIRGVILSVETVDDHSVAVTLDDGGAPGENTSFIVTDDTRIHGPKGSRLGIDDLAAGVHVRGVVVEQGDGSLWARHLRVFVPVDPATVGALDGPVTAVAEGGLTVAGVDFSVGDFTRLRRGAVLPTGPGARVKVRFVWLEDGTLQAVRIILRNRTPSRDPIRADGIVAGIDEDTVVVTGIPVIVPEGTPVVNRDGEDVDLAVGDPVRVFARYDETDGLVAFRIAVGEPFVTGGEVESMTDDRLTVDGEDFIVDEDTDAVDDEGSPIEPRAIRAGDYVEVISLQDRDGTPMADQVTILASTYSTGPGDADVPVSFELRQNYPNPFNPQTTITIVLSENVESVRLDVYNLLGQNIRSLLAGRLPAGTHALTWNGLTDAGASASSGVYLYRLQAGHATETRMMTLLR